MSDQTGAELGLCREAFKEEAAKVHLGANERIAWCWFEAGWNRRSPEPDAESDRLCEKIIELFESGTCPGCMATDEAAHKEGCPVLQAAKDISRSGEETND